MSKSGATDESGASRYTRGSPATPIYRFGIILQGAGETAFFNL